jgi:hypothetical protein
MMLDEPMRFVPLPRFAGYPLQGLPLVQNDGPMLDPIKRMNGVTNRALRSPD